MQTGDVFFSKILKDWYLLNKRNLPWRETSDPYLIWVSEIILQQTRVNQGYDYYVRFIEQFPNIKALASADEDIVMKFWQGLGYYSRARNLHAAAKMVLTDYGGCFPKKHSEILSLKGIGEYTAAAIASIAFALPYAVVDGNVFRVLSRVFGISIPIDTGKGKKYFSELANQLLDKGNPGDYNQALMDFGALQCVPVSPNCEICPFVEKCSAYINKQIGYLPLKEGKIKIKDRFFNYIDIRFEDFLFLNKRIGNDIWKNLYELPLIETHREFDLSELVQLLEFKILFPDSENFTITSTSMYMKHVLSHRIIHARFYKIEVLKDPQLPPNLLKIEKSKLLNYPVPRLVEKYFDKQKSVTLT